MNLRKGSALLVVMFISLVALSIAISMMQLSSTKTLEAINNKDELKAFYAAESGMNQAIDTLSDNLTTISTQPTEADLNLPDAANVANLEAPATGAKTKYFVDISYPDAETIIIESTGKYKDAAKKIRVKAKIEIEEAFKFGLLSKEQINIHTGNITFGLDLHGNSGLDFKGNEKNYNALNGSKATQSADKNPEQAYDYYGGYRPEVSVPKVDFPYFQSQMFGAVTPGTGDDDLSILFGIDDADNNIMLTKEYLQSNDSIEVPAPDQPAASLSKKTRNYIANFSQNLTYYKNPVMNLLQTTTTKPCSNVYNKLLLPNIFKSFIPVNSTYSVVMNYGVGKYFFGAKKTDTPTPTPVPPTVTPVPTATPTPTNTSPPPTPTNTPTYTPVPPEPTPVPTATPTPTSVGGTGGDAGSSNNNGNGNGNSNSNGNSNGNSNSSNSGSSDSSSGSSSSSSSNNSNSSGSSSSDSGSSNGSDSSSNSNSNSNSGNNGNSDQTSNNYAGGDISLTLAEGDYGGRIIYVDNKDIGTLDIDLIGNVTNVIIVATGDVRFNGSTNKNSKDSVSAMIDFVIAAGGNVRHNGSNTTGCFYWLDGIFDQNGSSDFVNGRVMAQGNINLNGKFELSTTSDMQDFSFIPKKIAIMSWQQIPVG